MVIWGWMTVFQVIGIAPVVYLMMTRSPSGGAWEHSAVLYVDTDKLVAPSTTPGSWDIEAMSNDSWAAKRGTSTWFQKGTCGSEPTGTCAMCFDAARDLKAGVCWHDSTGANYSVPLYKLCAECPSGCGPFRHTPHVDNNIVLDDNTVLNTVLAALVAFWSLNSLLERSRAGAFHKRIHNLSAELQVLNNQLHHEVTYSNMVKRTVTEAGLGVGVPASTRNWIVMARKGLLERHLDELEAMESEVRHPVPPSGMPAAPPLRSPSHSRTTLDGDIGAAFGAAWLPFLREASGVAHDLKGVGVCRHDTLTPHADTDNRAVVGWGTLPMYPCYAYCPCSNFRRAAKSLPMSRRGRRGRQGEPPRRLSTGM